MSLALKKAGIKDTEREKIARFCEADFSNSPSLTSQSFADEVNINKIMARVLKGQTILASDGEPFYGDVSNIGDYKQALETVMEAETLFGQFDASVRERFKNDPGELLSFLSDANNKEEAYKLGLNVKPVEEKAPEAPVK